MQYLKRWQLLREWVQEEQGKLYDDNGHFDKSDKFALGQHAALVAVLDKMTDMDFEEGGLTL